MNTLKSSNPNRILHSDPGFTIVELLVVIIVIGILAAITIVSYSGISQKAINVSLQSDLVSGSIKLKMYQVEHSAYPDDIAETPVSSGRYCPNPDLSSGEYCFRSSTGNRFLGYSHNNTTTPQSFSINAANTNLVEYNITNNSSYSLVDPNWFTGQAESGYPTALVGKSVYKTDISGTPVWKTSDTTCVNPQCSATVSPAPDVNYPSEMVLVDPIANGGIDFSDYPAQTECKSIGGRLPTMNELLAIYAGKTVGHYGSFTNIYYWSATQYVDRYGVASSYKVHFNPGAVDTWGGMTATNFRTRCVK